MTDKQPEPNAKQKPRFTLVPGGEGYTRYDELPDLGVAVRTERYPRLLDGQTGIEQERAFTVMSVARLSDIRLTDTEYKPIYWREVLDDNSNAALDERHQATIDRLRIGTIRSDGTHLALEDVAVEVYRYMQERLAAYERQGEFESDTDDPDMYDWQVEVLVDDAYDAYDLSNEDEAEADSDRPLRVIERMRGVYSDWSLPWGSSSRTSSIVFGMADDIVGRWKEEQTAKAEGRLPSAMSPAERHNYALTVALEELQKKPDARVLGDVDPEVMARLAKLDGLRARNREEHTAAEEAERGEGS